MASVVGNRRFRPSTVGVVLTALGVAVCFRLGMWQVDRAEEKRAMLTALASGSERSVVVTGELKALPRYQSVELTGSYDTRHQVLLDNMFSARGQLGYRVLTALQLQNGRWVLVDRGWIAAGRTRAQLPNIDADERLRIVRGQLDEFARPGLRLGGASAVPVNGAAAPQWPLVLNYPTHQELEAALDRPLATSVVLLDASQPDGYERVWRARFGFGPERHLGYAVQWFGLLAAIIVTFLVVSLKKVADNHGS